MKRRIFLLEDDPAVAELISTAAGSAGYELLHQVRAAGALEAMLRFRPDLAVLDVELPDGSGFDVCAAARARPELEETPIIFLTAKTDAASRLRGFTYGAQDYVPKPFVIEELLARIRVHLEAARGRADSLGDGAKEALKERLRRDLADTIVHDLKSPLGAIKATLSLLDDSGLIANADYLRLVRNAESSADFLLMMINDLLDISADKLRVDAEPLDLAAIEGRLRELFEAPMRRREMTFSVLIEADGSRVSSDPTIVLRVLSNLLSNAVKFSLKGAPIDLTVRPAGDGLRFEVLDRAPGIPDAEKKLIFQKHYRGAEPPRAEGNGIGLSFCRLAASALGGRIGVEDREGGGSRFVFEIPAAPAPAGATPESFSRDFGADLMAEFLTGCRTALAGAQKDLETLAAGRDPAAAERLRSAMHALAGSAGTYGYPAASAAALVLEKRFADLIAARKVPAASDLARFRREFELLRDALSLPDGV